MGVGDPPESGSPHPGSGLAMPTASVGGVGTEADVGRTPTLAVLPRGRFMEATGTDTGATIGAATVPSKVVLDPGGLCLSPSALSTCLGGLQDSGPNTWTWEMGGAKRNNVRGFRERLP